MIFDEGGFIRTLWYGQSRIWQKARKYRCFGGFKRNHLWLSRTARHQGSETEKKQGNLRERRFPYFFNILFIALLCRDVFLRGEKHFALTEFVGMNSVVAHERIEVVAIKKSLS